MFNKDSLVGAGLGVVAGFLLAKTTGAIAGGTADPLLDAIAKKVVKIDIKLADGRVFPTEFRFVHGYLAGGTEPKNTWLVQIPSAYAGDNPVDGVLTLHYSGAIIVIFVAKTIGPEFAISIPGRTWVIPLTDWPNAPEVFIAGMAWSAPVTKWQEWVNQSI